MLCVAILGSGLGQNEAETARDHKFVSGFHENESENAPARPKLSRRFSVSGLSPPVSARPAGRHAGFYDCMSGLMKLRNCMS